MLWIAWSTSIKNKCWLISIIATPTPKNSKVTLSHINSVYCLKSICKMSALFVRQSVYVYEFLIHCLTKYVEVFMQIYIICHPLLSFQSILYATRYIVLDDICVSVILLKCLKRAYRFIKSLCHSHFWINAFPSRKFSTMSSLLTKSPGIPGVTLCFCTGSYAAAAGRRVLFTR